MLRSFVCVFVWLPRLLAFHANIKSHTLISLPLPRHLGSLLFWVLTSFGLSNSAVCSLKHLYTMLSTRKSETYLLVLLAFFCAVHSECQISLVINIIRTIVVLGKQWKRCLLMLNSFTRRWSSDFFSLHFVVAVLFLRAECKMRKANQNLRCLYCCSYVENENRFV